MTVRLIRVSCTANVYYTPHMAAPPSVQGVTPDERLEVILRAALFTVAFAYVAMFIAVVSFRLVYPFELERLEGAAADEVARILSAQPLYVRPSFAFVPFLYTPLYFEVAALLARCIGFGLLPLRIVSLAASVGSFLLIFMLVHRETRNRPISVLSVCLFIATYRASGMWFDVGRVDALLLFLLLATLYLLRVSRSLAGFAAAGVVFALAVLTKQTALVFLSPLVLYRCWQDRRALACAAAAVLTLALAVFLIEPQGVWFRYYAMTLAGHQGWSPHRLWQFWIVDMVATLPVASALGVWLARRAGRSPDERRWHRFYVVTTVSLIAGSWLARVNRGGFSNVLLPAYAALAICFGLGLHQVFLSREAGLIRWSPARIYAACLVQFLLLAYVPWHQVPSSQDLATGWAVVRTIRQVHGDVWVAGHGHLARLAGKAAHPTVVPIADVMAVNDVHGRDLLEELSGLLRDGRFGAVLLDAPIAPLTASLERCYGPVEKLLSESVSFRPIVGGGTRPELMYRRKPVCDP